MNGVRLGSSNIRLAHDVPSNAVLVSAAGSPRAFLGSMFEFDGGMVEAVKGRGYG